MNDTAITETSVTYPFISTLAFAFGFALFLILVLIFSIALDLNIHFLGTSVHLHSMLD